MIDVMDSSERQTCQAAIHGDRDAFEMIIRSSSRTLFAIAYGILQSREEAEDVVQDAFIKAWKSRWRVREPEKFPAWLAAIVRNRARDLIRARKTVPLGDELDQTADDSTTVPNQSPEVNGEIRAALAALPEMQRTAIALRYFEEMDYGTIEQTLGLTNGALRGILGRGLQLMRRRLQPALAALQQ